MDLYDHTADPDHHGLTSEYPPGETFYYEMFARESKAGESFTYRNETYHAPALITYPGNSAVPEPTSLSSWLTILGTAGGLAAWRRWNRAHHSPGGHSERR